MVNVTTIDITCTSIISIMLSLNNHLIVEAGHVNKKGYSQHGMQLWMKFLYIIYTTIHYVHEFLGSCNAPSTLTRKSHAKKYSHALAGLVSHSSFPTMAAPIAILT